jgi:signal transduction histidine kinase
MLPTRLFLLVSMLLHPLLYPFVNATWPDEWDPLSARLALSAVTGLALAATWHPAMRRHGSTLAVAIACVMQAWYLHLGHLNGLMVERSINALMILVASVAVCRHLWQLGLFVAVTSASLAWAYASPHAHDIPQFGMQTTVGVIGTGIALVIHYRGKLEAALADQTAHAHALSIEVERRRHAEQEALKASRAKSTFLANMSHELRTPLTTIVGYGELVGEDLVGTDAEPLSEDVDRILVSARHLLGLIDEVLDLARIESGKLDLRPQSVDLSALVDECLDLMAPVATARHNELTRSVDPSVPAWGDADRIRQVVLNLLSNAIKFTTAGTVSVTVCLRDDQALLSVADTGCGIPRDALRTLFDPFVRAHVQPHGAHGTGLGLAISRELVHHMGGALKVTSEVGEGSTFTVALPLVAPGPAQSASQSTTSTV